MSAEPEWRRPHPLTVLVLIVSFLTGNAFPLLAVFAFGGGGLGFDTAAVVGGAVTVGMGALGWFMTGYAVTEEAVHHRSGILSRQARSIPLGRIQQVAVLEPVVARAVGLAVVQVAEASADGDVEIRYLGKADATALTLRLRALARPVAEPTAGPAEGATTPAGATSSLAPPPDPPAAVVHRTETRSLLRFLLASAVPGLLLALAALAVAVFVVALATGGAVAPLLTALVGVGVLLGLLALATLAGVLTSGGFRLQRSRRALTLEAGVLSRRQVEVRPDRIQTVTVRSGPVARRIDLHQIEFSAATGKSAGGGMSIVHLSPAATSDEIVRIVEGAADVDPAFGVALEPVSRLTIRRQLVRSAVAHVLVVLPGSVGLWFAHPVAAVLPSLVWWPAAVWYARARHRRFGLALDERRLVVRRGVFEHHLTQIPRAHVQSVSTRATFFQRRLGLCDLVVSTAGIGPGNHVAVPDLPAARGRTVARELAITAADTRWELRI